MPNPSDEIKHIPVQSIGLYNLSAIPYLLSVSEPLHTMLRLGLKGQDILPVLSGLTRPVTINGITLPAFVFMFGATPSNTLSDAAAALLQALQTDPQGTLSSILTGVGGVTITPTVDPLTQLSLESPEQFAMAWTSFAGIDKLSEPYLPRFVSNLTDPDAATNDFWPMLADFSLGHNLLVLEKINGAKAVEVKELFGDAWHTEEMRTLSNKGLLYGIDMRLFDFLASSVPSPSGKYTHATFTVLKQDPQTKNLVPVAVWISGKNVAAPATVFTRANASPSAWIWALLAAKVSITVHAIFFRHVYLWHVSSATMQMTVNNALPPDHFVSRLLGPQSKYTIAFDEVMLLLWSAATPPASIATAPDFLRISNEFAKGRDYFDDDPKVAIRKLGLREEDFTRNAPWDVYVALRELLELYDATEEYVDACVDATYANDGAVASDHHLRRWLAACSAPDQGNIPGLKPLANRAALKRLLTSILYRIVAHGGPNMAFPTLLAHLFVANFPICLQRRDIPTPDTHIGIRELMTYLPNTGTIGQSAAFFYTFAFGKPYEPFIPQGAVTDNLFFPGGLLDARNRALVAYRNKVIQFINARAIVPFDEIHQWPLNVET